MKKKIAIFGGSFNPPTYAHMKIIGTLINTSYIEKCIVLPCAFRNDKDFFASDFHRINMLKLGLKNYHNIKNPITINSQD